MSARPITAKQLARKRRLAGFTQESLAKALGVHRITVSRWENGRQPISRGMSVAIRSFLEPEIRSRLGTRAR